jgi:hypothetical protein
VLFALPAGCAGDADVSLAVVAHVFPINPTVKEGLEIRADGSAVIDGRVCAVDSDATSALESLAQRTWMQNSGGNAGNCNGSLSFDLLAFLAAHPAALGHPLFVGERFYVQAWYRDTLAPAHTNLSNAARVELCP